MADHIRYQNQESVAPIINKEMSFLLQFNAQLPIKVMSAGTMVVYFSTMNQRFRATITQ